MKRVLFDLFIRLTILSSCLLLYIFVSYKPTTANSDVKQLDSPEQLKALQQIWSPVLGVEGPQTLDRLITQYTPVCLKPSTEAELVDKANQMRASVIKQLDLDLARPALSTQIQRTIDMDGYQIDIVRLEIFPKLYLPINVYVPDLVNSHPVPLVLSIPGCGSSVSTDVLQIMGANLAKLGMVVVVPEGFCNNGARSQLESNENINYAKALIGLPGSTFEMFLQELVSTVTWAVEAYPSIDQDRIGAIGYSYGGQMAMLLAAIDTRIHSISVPATYIGDPCTNFLLNSDISIESFYSDFIWGAPLRLPILPISWRIPLLYPRSLHVTAGFNDAGANPSFLDGVITYTQQLYSLGNQQDRLLYRTDNLDHNYQQSRREDTYEWLIHTLLGEPLVTQTEAKTTLLPQEQLGVNIAGTTTTPEMLYNAIDTIMQSRLSGSNAFTNTIETIHSLMPDFVAIPLTRELVWQQSVGNLYVQAFRIEGGYYDFPIFIFENGNLNNNNQLLFLPQTGTYQELEKIVELLQQYHTVISLDYAGIGELKSNRILLHSYARYFMHNEPNAPKLNVEMIASYLVTFHPQPIDIYANGWVSSFYGLIAKWLEPQNVASINPNGVPVSELRYIKSGNKIPDLLLWGNLFTTTSARELAEALPFNAKLTINQGALDSTSVDTIVTAQVITDSVTVQFVQLSNNGLQWQAFGWENVQLGIPWRLDPATEVPIVYARLVDTLGNISPIMTDTIRLVDFGEQATGITINHESLFVNTRTVTLNINAPAQTTQMSIRDAVASVSAAETDSPQAWQWEPYASQQEWSLANYGVSLPNRIVYVQFRDAFGKVSQSYFDEIILDETPPTAIITLQNGAAYSNQQAVTLESDANDQLSGVSEMQVSENPTLSDVSWQPFSTTSMVTFTQNLNETSGFIDGDKQIYARFRDHAGNLSSIVSDTILIDTIAPTGTVAIIDGISDNGIITLNLQLDANDSLSGLAEMHISYNADSLATLWQPYSKTLTYEFIEGDLPATIFVQYRDHAGNVSNPVSTTIIDEPIHHPSEHDLSNDVYLPLITR